MDFSQLLVVRWKLLLNEVLKRCVPFIVLRGFFLCVYCTFHRALELFNEEHLNGRLG